MESEMKKLMNNFVTSSEALGKTVDNMENFVHVLVKMTERLKNFENEVDLEKIDNNISELFNKMDKVNRNLEGFNKRLDIIEGKLRNLEENDWISKSVEWLERQEERFPNFTDDDIFNAVDDGPL